MPRFRPLVDLHVHTRCSDGGLSPDDVVAHALALGLRALAITDHDTVAGNGPALEAARGTGLDVLPGVELSTQWNGLTFHLLGYGLHRHDPAVRDTFAFLAESRRRRTPRIVEKMRALGVSITLDEVVAEAAGALVGRPHVARVLLRRRAVATIQEAFDRFLGRGAAAYVDKERLTPEEACRLVRAAGGVVVLAHPGLIEKDHPGRLAPLLDALVPLGLEGIEAHYSRHTARQTEAYVETASRLGLLVTGGSDFHQPDEAGPALGTGFGNLRVPLPCVAALKRRLDER